MFVVTCTFPNASTLINGVAFAPLPGGEGVRSVEPVSEAAAAPFVGVPGVRIEPVGGGEGPGGSDPASATNTRPARRRR